MQSAVRRRDREETQIDLQQNVLTLNEVCIQMAIVFNRQFKKMLPFSSFKVSTQKAIVHIDAKLTGCNY